MRATPNIHQGTSRNIIRRDKNETDKHDPGWIVFTSRTAALAQQQAQEPPPKANVFLVYSYLRFNPTLPAGRNRSFNGGGGVLPSSWASILAQGRVHGIREHNLHTTVTAPVATNHGTIPVGTFSSQGNMFTYMFGPVVRLPGKVTPFAEILFVARIPTPTRA